MIHTGNVNWLELRSIVVDTLKIEAAYTSQRLVCQCKNKRLTQKFQFEITLYLPWNKNIVALTY